MDDHTILPYHIIEVKLGVNPFYIVSRPKTAWNTPFLVLYYQGQTWGHPSTSYTDLLIHLRAATSCYITHPNNLLLIMTHTLLYMYYQGQIRGQFILRKYLDQTQTNFLHYTNDSDLSL